MFESYSAYGIRVSMHQKALYKAGSSAGAGNFFPIMSERSRWAAVDHDAGKQ